MKLELVEFYPRKIPTNKAFVGTAHIYLEELDIDIKGVKIYQTNKGYICRLPDLVGKDHKTKQSVRFPVFQFANRNTHKGFIKDLEILINEYFKEKKSC